MSFDARNQIGIKSEQHVRAELEQRGYFVHPWGRSGFPAAINNALNVFRDTYSRPCRLRWLPEFLVVRPGDPQTLRAVEVKRHRGIPQVSRLALNTYLRLESEMWIPVLIVFQYCATDELELDSTALCVMPAGEALMSGRNKWGADSECSSSEPYFDVDPRKLHPFDKFFGAKP